MNDQPKPKIPLLVRLSLGTAILGVLLCLPLLVRETPYTFVIFMFLGQPLLAIAFLLFVAKVIGDLRSRELL